MTQREKLDGMKARAAKLEGTPKNIKAPGVLKALKREIIRLEEKMQ